MGPRCFRARRAGGGSSAGRLLLVAGVALLCAGCNIFSWTHDEGGSSDPDTLLQDAEAALANRDYDDALAFAQKGIDHDPDLNVPRLRYVASQAVLARSGIAIADYLNVFTSRKPRAKARGDEKHPFVREDLLNLSLEELRAIAASCPQAIAYLRDLVDGLQDGSITNADLAGARFDVDVGFAVGSLLTAFVTILDADQDLSNGFDLHPDVQLVSGSRGGYEIVYTANVTPVERDQFISDVLVCPLWNRTSNDPSIASIVEALESVYDAYLVAKGRVAADIGCVVTRDRKPRNIDTGMIIGQMLDFVYDGVAQLYSRYVASTCGCAGGGS